MKRFLLLWAMAGVCLAQSPHQVWVVNQNNGAVAPKPFEQSVAEGLVEGYSFIQKFGETPLVTTASDPEDLWDGGGLYTFSTTADINQLSSSDNGDTQQIEVQGLDANTNLLVQTVALTGQTPVTLSTNLYRVFRMKNLGSTDVAGSVYLSTNNAALASGVPALSDTRAIINNGKNQTLMCIYTIPVGKTGYLEDWYISVLRSGGGATPVSATFSLRAREAGGVFQVKNAIDGLSSGSSGWHYDFKYGLMFPEGTDIIVRCEEVSNDVGASGGFTVLLKDN